MQLITKINYLEAMVEYSHLFEISSPPSIMKEKDLSFVVREEISQGGTLLVGDLIVKKRSTNILEAHPFPEWVVQLYNPGINPGKLFLILPKFSTKQVKRFNRKSLALRFDKIKDALSDLTAVDFLVIEYVPGLCVKIPPNIPHEFVSITTNEQKNPYCQVFEPNYLPLSELLKFDVTKFFTLGFELKI
ncbi:hypothetical protein [Candidatus Harpocratesius sp.]